MPEVLEKVTQPQTAKEFAQELRRLILPVQAALKQLLVEWGSPLTSGELDRLSGAGTTICWQVFRVVNAADVVAEARNVPSHTYLRRLLAAAEKAGVSGEAIRAVEVTAREYKAFTKRAATDRAAFDSMLAGIGGESQGGGGEKIDLAQRRTAYRAMSGITGTQTDLLYYAAMVRKAADESKVESLMFWGQRGLRRLRPSAKVPVFGYHNNPSAVPGARQVEGALDEVAAERYGMPVLPEFSDEPLPKMEKVSLPSGYVLYNVAEGAIGAAGSINCMIARYHGVGEYMREADGRRLYHQTLSHIRKPVAMAVQELLVHRPSFPAARPEMVVYQHMEGGWSQECVRQAQQYALEEKLTWVGRADEAMLGEVPRYGELLRFGAGRLGWDLSEFEVWRVRMPYPIMLSAVRLYFYVD